VSTHDRASELVRAVAARDLDGMVRTLATDVRFRYLIPPGPGEVIGAAEVATKYLEWFGDADAVEVQDILVHQVSDRTSARYRFLLREQEGWEVVEQQTFLDVDTEGQITAIDLLCSGFRPAEGPDGVSSLETHEFDAGTMGCTDGLAPEFRRRIGAIPVGDVLVVTARDPAAKEDLPPLARMMGHTVRSIEAPGDGRLLITVERGR
jgi:TusA-related sulfurtransferase